MRVLKSVHGDIARVVNSRCRSTMTDDVQYQILVELIRRVNNSYIDIYGMLIDEFK